MIDLDRELQLSRQLVGAKGEKGPAVKHAKLDASPIELDDRGWALLSQFRMPATPRSIFARLALDAAAERAATEAIRRFVALGLLVGPNESDHLFENWVRLQESLAPSYVRWGAGFLGSEHDIDAADFQIVGVPFDRAAKVPGAARAPRAIREVSNLMPSHSDPRTGEFRGLWDHDACHNLLEGAKICDAGDIFLENYVGLQDSYERIHRTVTDLLARSTGTPVFLGGDHSITEPILRAFVHARGPVFLIHLDAHTDMAPSFRGRLHHHGSVMDLVRRTQLATGILQLGVRDLGPPWFQSADNVTVLSSERVRSVPVEAVLEHVPADATCYVSIDIDVLDPSEAPGTGMPVPGGLRLAEVERAVAAIGSARTIGAIDLVEVAPDLDRGRVTSWCAVRVLLRVMDAVWTRTPRALAYFIRERLHAK